MSFTAMEPIKVEESQEGAFFFVFNRKIEISRMIGEQYRKMCRQGVNCDQVNVNDVAI